MSGGWLEESKMGSMMICTAQHGKQQRVKMTNAMKVKKQIVDCPKRGISSLEFLMIGSAYRYVIISPPCYQNEHALSLSGITIFK